MEPNQIGFTIVLVLVLIGIALYFGRQQLKTLRGLKSPTFMEPGDRRYLRSQAYRRIFSSFLMVVIAGLLIGWLFLEADYRQLEKEMHASGDGQPAAAPTEHQKEFARLFWFYLSAALMVLLVLLVLASMDFWATARYGLTERRKLLADRRALLEAQMARRRQERNGQHEV
jgi:hypothetical protein